MDRWATFDCYGTLIDWNGGIGRELERLFGAANAPRLLHRYHEIEPEVQREEPVRAYRDVLNVTLARLAASEGLALPGRRGRRALALAADLGAVPRGARVARGRARPRLEARHPVQHRPRLHRGVDGADRRPVRAGDRRVRDRLVQAGAAPLGGLLRAHRRRPGRPRPRGRQPLPRHRSRRRSSGCGRSGSTGSARSPSRSPMSSCTRSPASAPRWTGSSPGSLPA